jgi:SAM-dependent methyltransferase
MRECSKSISRRLNDARFARSYLVGDGVDIGGKPDPLALYRELFPLMRSVKTWDREDGDAQFMASAEDESFDFVFSSHCLEHLSDADEGLRNWLRVLKPGGHMVVCVPDEDLYEQGKFPSTFNRDHKWTFTVWKERSWSERSINLLDLLSRLGAGVQICKIEQIDTTFRASLPRFDQTLTPIAECAIEFVLRKRPVAEIAAGGRLPGMLQPDAGLRIHYNQYRDDHRNLKASNSIQVPFTNTEDL